MQSAKIQVFSQYLVNSSRVWKFSASIIALYLAYHTSANTERLTSTLVYFRVNDRAYIVPAGPGDGQSLKLYSPIKMPVGINW